MKETFKILSRLAKHKAHVETEITIDWEGTSPEQMQILARGFLVYCAQAAWAKDGKAPETHSIKASKQAHPYVPTVCTYTPPPPKPSQLSQDFEDLMKNLTGREKDELLEALAAMN